MTGEVRLVGLSAVALLGFGAIAAVSAALAHRLVAARIAALPPALRARALLAWAATPATVAAALVTVALWPSLGASLGLALDHCPEHGGHVHLCLRHLPARGPGLAAALALAGLGGLAIAALVHGIRAAILGHALARAASRELSPGVGVVPSPRPFALTVGWLRPSVLVSSALVERLAPAQLEIVVAHEASHAARRDALALTCARVLALAHLPWVRRRILAGLTLASEQACDEAAAGACGDRVLVAETILAAERAAAAAGTLAVAGPAFGGGVVEERVEALLAPPCDVAPSRGLGLTLLSAAALLVLVLVALAVASPHVHHWTETLLHLLLH